MPQGLPYGLPHFNPRSPCGERRAPSGGCAGAHDFNPRSPCGERRRRCAGRGSGRDFNPRSPCGERPLPPSAPQPTATFQSTLPVRGATGRRGCHSVSLDISIHAPRAGSDQPDFSGNLRRCNFNPRSPCGERHIDILDAFEYSWISIHAPRAGSDAKK